MSRQSCIHRIKPAVRKVACGPCGSSVSVYACDNPDQADECVLSRGTGKKRKTVEALGMPICCECEFRDPGDVLEEIEEEVQEVPCETGLCESWIRDRLTKPHLIGKPIEFYVIDPEDR